MTTWTAQHAQVDLTHGRTTPPPGEPSVGEPDRPGTSAASYADSRAPTPGSGTSRTVSRARLTLDAQGDPTRGFIFQIGSTLTTASTSSVVLTNGASPCNVYWQVGSSATAIGGRQQTSSARSWPTTSITVEHAAPTCIGRMLARNGRGDAGHQHVHQRQAAPRAARHARRARRRSPAAAPATPGAYADPGHRPSRPERATPAVWAARATPATSRRPQAGPRNAPGGEPSDPAAHARQARETCTDGFSARVRGSLVKSVVFRLDGKRIATQPPLTVPRLRQGRRRRAGTRSRPR